MATAIGALVSEATMPASNSPSCGPPPAKVECAAEIRPRRRSGVTMLRRVWRWETLTESATPLTARRARESKRLVLNAKPVNARP
jgi:hypothetical protein